MHIGNPSNEERRAYHEAAHAVAILESGWDLQDVTIEPGFDRTDNLAYEGRAQPRTPGHALAAAHPSKWAVQLLAGSMAADRKLVNGPGNPLCEVSEVAKADALAGAHRDQCHADAWALVERCWPEIHHVAQALLKCETLSGDEVKDIVAKARAAHNTGVPGS